MNIKDFFDLPDDQREMLIDIHRRQKLVRAEKEYIATERRKLETRELNNRMACEHPFATEEYKAYENEFGNLTGGGEYRYHCEDCGKRWSKNK